MLTQILLFSILTFLIFSTEPMTLMAAEPADTQVLEITLADKGFQPHVFQADPDKPTTLKVTRSTSEKCTLSVLVKAKKIKRKLPLNKAVLINIGKLEPGELKFYCEKGMTASGLIYVK